MRHKIKPIYRDWHQNRCSIRIQVPRESPSDFLLIQLLSNNDVKDIKESEESIFDACHRIRGCDPEMAIAATCFSGLVGNWSLNGIFILVADLLSGKERPASYSENRRCSRRPFWEFQSSVKVEGPTSMKRSKLKWVKRRSGV